ncbi:MAG: glycosyltransferase family 39 protein [Candidatus Omnitrophota bacterium]|jgi:hypothetical protein
MRPSLTFHNQDKDHIAAVALMAAVFSYTLARALLIPIFHDEAYTYFTYGQSSLPVILGELGNNHILNTLLIKCSVWLFGLSELSLRLPALGGHLFFLMGAYRALNFFLEKKAFIAGIVLLTFNLFVLELFSAGRGYALGLGFFMQAMVHFLRGLESRQPRELRAMFSFLALAVLSHLSFLHVYVPALIICGMALLCHHGWFQPRRNRSPGIILWRDSRFPLILSGLLFLALVRPVWIQLKTGGFYHGGETGFLHDTIRSLGMASLYNRVILPENYWILVYMALTGCVVLPGIFLMSRWKRSSALTGGERMLAGSFSLLLGTMGLIVVFHSLLGIKYVMGRMAVFLVPLFWLTMALFWACLSNVAGRGSRLWLNWAAGIVVVTGLVFFATGMNFKNYTIAPEDDLSRQIISVLQTARQKGTLGAKDITLGTHYLFVPSLHFYCRKNHLPWLEVVDITNTGSVSCDVYYIFERAARGVSKYNVARDFEKIDKTPLRIMARYPSHGTVLALSSPAGF